MSTPLERAGYSITLIDSTITPNFEARVLEEVKDALCLGISLVTGPMIRGAIEVATAVKNYTPWLPVIFGGWHPNMGARQLLHAPARGCTQPKKGAARQQKVEGTVSMGASGIVGCLRAPWAIGIKLGG